MSLEADIQAAVTRALKALDGSARYELMQSQVELQEFYADNMQSATTANNVRTKTGKLRALKNKTDKLYVLYGNLIRALMPNGRGNISKYESEGAKKYMRIGIDTAVIPYAAAHEFGGRSMPARPYFYPALKAYSEQRLNERIANIIDAAVVAWNS